MVRLDQCHAQTGSRRLIHLAEHKSGVLQNACFFHFDPQVVTLWYVANTGEHGGTTEATSHTGNHFLDQHGLTHACTTEQDRSYRPDVGSEGRWT